MGLPLKWLLERLRLVKREHEDSVVGMGPSKEFLAKEMNRREKHPENQLSGTGPEKEFWERSSESIEVMSMIEEGIRPEIPLLLRLRLWRLLGNLEPELMVMLLLERESAFKC